jgi:charged multivesicular body protein 6
MGNGKSKEQDVITDHDRAMLDLRNARDTLKQYQKKLTTNMEREREVAKLLLKKGDKTGALFVLKKKKLQESMLEKTHTQLDNVSQLIDSLDFAQVNQRVFESLQKGKDALKELNAVLSVEDVERLLDENADQIALAAELDAAVARHLGTGNELDEGEIEREYQDLLAMEGDSLKLPDAPVHDPVVPVITPAAAAVGKKPVKEPAKTALPAN